ncbi:MAG TPA: hypothetical protein VGP52_12185 [Stellaceae bacterium]|nr:hypothetical protein [Stellaceae bacterium]
MPRFFLPLAVIALGLATGSAANAQSNVTCTGTLAAGTYNNVTVPNDASCTIGTGVLVIASVSVGSGATLDMLGATVDGNVTAKNATSITIDEAEPAAVISTVGTNVTLVGTTGLILIRNASIGVNLTIVGSTGAEVHLLHNTVGTNLVVQGDSGLAIPQIALNMVGGNLACVDNTPPPSDIIAGIPSPNTVGGTASGQCARLVGITPG